MVAAAFTHFHEFGKHLGEAVHNLGSHTFKVALTNTEPAFDTDVTISDITQIANGNGYSTGGSTAGSPTWAETEAGSGIWQWTTADVVFTASGGSIGPFRYAVVYNDTPTSPADPLIGYLDYGSSITVTDTNTFTVDVTALGIITLTVPSPDLEPAIVALFANGEQGAWYDPSDFSTMFQDSAGTTPVTAVDQPVGKINDKSGRGNHAVQATANYRPVLKQDGNGKYYLEFDAEAELASAAFIADGVEIFGATAVSMTSTASDYQCVWAHGLDTPAEMVMFQRRGNTAKVAFRIDNETLGGGYNQVVNGELTALESSPPHVVVLQAGPSTGRDIYVDGVADTAAAWHGGTLVYPTARPISLGKGPGAGFLAGNIYGLIYRSAAAQPASDVADAYLANKSGVTL